MSDFDNNEKAAFFAMIRADPGNDNTRLVFADWCEEHGEVELAADQRGGSESWLRTFAAEWKPYESEAEAYRHLLEDAKEGFFSAHGRDLVKGELDAREEELFFRHLQIMTGQSFDKEHREKFGWSCSC